MDLLPILFTLLGAYALLAVILGRNLQSELKQTNDWQPLVSVVIACKDEENNLPHLFRSLQQLDYPQEKLDIVLIDDASTDSSGNLINQFKTENPGIIALSLAPGEKEKPGKAGALLAGIDKSRGEVIFITDADCEISPDWIRSLLLGFHENIGIVGGYTFIDQPKSLFDQLQAIDWQFLLTVAAAASQLNWPITWVGNNLAILRSAYDDVGGYRSLPDSVVEDFALIDAIERSTHWSCRFFTMQHGAVKTQPLPSLRHLYNQRKRWAAGISGARPFGLLIMSTAFLTHILIIISLFKHPFCGLLALLLKMWSDARILSNRTQIDQKPNIGRSALFQLYYIAYCVILPFLYIFDRRIVWKGQAFKRN